MLRKTLIALVTGTGLIIATAGTAAAAKPAGGIWTDNSPKKGSTKPKPSDSKQEEGTASSEPAPGEPAAAANADANADVNASADAPAGAKSQGAVNANLGAVAQANSNSALAAGAVASSALPGLTTGLNVKTSAGASLGTVSQVVTGEDGSIRLVVVAGVDGKTHRLLPNQLSISGGVVTTTQTDLSG